MGEIWTRQACSHEISPCVKKYFYRVQILELVSRLLPRLAWPRCVHLLLSSVLKTLALPGSRDQAARTLQVADRQ